MATISPCTRLALLLLLPHFLTLSLAAEDDLIIDTRHGKVQGKLLSAPGGDVRAFLGIPYGKPPLGKLRFRAPQPVEKWEGVRDATRYSNSCYQVPDSSFPGFKGEEMWNPNTPLSEDCLYLNVWSPRINKTQPQPMPLAPVLVWIYGGGFYSGTSSLDVYDGRFLSKSEGVVVVSMNYRLGALGFLSIPDNKNIQSNVGLRDQHFALQWVADNIAAFGGDPTKVTLFGESAGSASVGYQLLSPGSQRLFQRAVMQSGSPNAYWAGVSQTEIWSRSMKLVTLLGCPTSPPSDMEACLLQANPKTITSKQNDVAPLTLTPFVPHVDGDFLPDKVEALLSSGTLLKKDVMFGLNKDEGTPFLLYGYPGFSLTGQSLITRHEFVNGVELALVHLSDVSRDAAIFHYTDWTDENDKIKNRDLLGRLVGDHMFYCPVLDFVHRQLRFVYVAGRPCSAVACVNIASMPYPTGWFGYVQRGGPAYLYFFDHRSSVNPWPEWMGAMHGYEIEFVFGMPLNASLGYTKNEVNMTKKFMKHWANFARTGNPGIDGANWPLFTPERQEYVTLNYNQPEQKRMLRAEENHLWNTLIPKLQKVSDDLLSCVTGNGLTLHCNYTLLFLLLLVITLTY